MSTAQQNSGTAGREESRLEKDSDQHCLECGIGLPFNAVLTEYERCPECILEKTKDELLVAFGSLNSVEVAPTWDTKSHLLVATEQVFGGHVKVFDDGRVEFVPWLSGSRYSQYAEEGDRDV